MPDSTSPEKALRKPQASRLETFAVQLTPAGRSAIAVVLVAGPAAIDAVNACFRAANGKPLAQQPTGAIRFGCWGQPRGEELVVCRRPTSGQQPPQVEVHCHGGLAAVRAVLSDLCQHGCTKISWREWRQQQATSTIATEAELALAAATTERTASVLLDQLQGALQAETRRAIAAVGGGDTVSAKAIVRALLQRLPLGLHLTTPWRVVFAGWPNVGKSSLMNAVVGYERAIVFDQPGTTRDVVTAVTALEGWPVQLSDTAGIRAAKDDLEAAGVQLAQQTLATADLLVAVAQANGDAEASWQAIASAAPAGTPLLRVLNKVDLASTPPDGERGFLTSAKTGQGIDRLMQQIMQTLIPHPPAAGDAVPFTERHHECLLASQHALEGGDPESALRAMQSLLS